MKTVQKEGQQGNTFKSPYIALIVILKYCQSVKINNNFK